VGEAEVALEESVSTVNHFYFEESSVSKYARQFKIKTVESDFAALSNSLGMNISPIVSRVDSQNAFLSVLVIRLVEILDSEIWETCHIMSSYDSLPALAEKGVAEAMRFGASYADARAGIATGTMIRRSNDVFDQMSRGVVNGVGIRALANGAWGFSSTVKMTNAAISETAKQAVRSAKAVSSSQKEKIKIEPVPAQRDYVRNRFSQLLSSVDISRKMKVTAELVEAARKYDAGIASASSVYVDGAGLWTIATSDGTLVQIESSRIFFTVNSVAGDSGRLVSAREFDGTREGFQALEKIDLDSFAVKASQRAISLQRAKPAPSGRLTIVMDPKLSGTFAHEAVGHACEADLVMCGESILQNLLDRTIASDLVTIYDDPTLEGGWGTYKYDDEGVPATKRTLVNKGRLVSYISSKETSVKLGIPLNGGARAESYADRPIVRMSNTYMSEGDHSVEELIERVDYGIFAKGTRGGQVDTPKGTFQFSAEEAYLIEKGKLTDPLLDVSLSGLTLETLKNIEALSKDIQHHPGFCGKSYQSIPAGDGAPHMLVRNVVVGGRR